MTDPFENLFEANTPSSNNESKATKKTSFSSSSDPFADVFNTSAKQQNQSPMPSKISSTSPEVSQAIESIAPEQKPAKKTIGDLLTKGLSMITLDPAKRVMLNVAGDFIKKSKDQGVDKTIDEYAGGIQDFAKATPIGLTQSAVATAQGVNEYNKWFYDTFTGGETMFGDKYSPTYEKAKESLNTRQDELTSYLTDKVGEKDINSFWTQSGLGLGQGIGQLATSYINPAVGVATISAQSIASGKDAGDLAYNTTIENGGTDEEARKNQNINGWITGAVNMLDVIVPTKTGGMLKNALLKPVEEVTEKAVKKGLLNDIWRISKTGITESLTEGAQDFTSGATAYMTYDKGRQPLGEAWNSILVSLPTSLLFGGVEHASNQLSRNRIEKAKEEMVSKGLEAGMDEKTAKTAVDLIFINAKIGGQDTYKNEQELDNNKVNEIAKQFEEVAPSTNIVTSKEGIPPESIYRKDIPVLKAFEESKQTHEYDNGVVLGTFGEKTMSRKNQSTDRFPISEIPETLKNVTDIYKASNDPNNYRFDNNAMIAEMPNGEKRVIYTRKNSQGNEEIVNAHIISNQQYIDDLRKNGVPERTRTSNLLVRTDTLYPLSYGNDKSIPEKTSKRQEQLKEPTRSPKTDEPLVSTLKGRKQAGLSPVGEGEKKRSSLFERVKDQVIQNEGVDYSVATRDTQIKKATDFVDEYFDRAIKISQGRELTPEGLLKNDIMTAVRIKLQEEGRISEASDILTAQTLQATRYGQEIQALSGLSDPNTISHWYNEITRNRIGEISKNIVYEYKKKGVTVTKENAIKTATKENVTKIKEVLTKSQIKLNRAQEILDALTC